MKESWEKSIDHILQEEGGFVNHPKDPGAATNMGITRATATDWFKRPVSIAEMRALKREVAVEIYKDRYWNFIRADSLPAGIDLLAFDIAVNMGPGRSIGWLYDSVGLQRRSAVTDQLILALSAADPATIIRKITEWRRSFYRGRKTFPTFGKGWLRRTDRIEKGALAMAGISA